MLGYLWWLLKDLHLNVDGVKLSSFSFTIVTLYLVLISCLEDISSSQGDISILDFSIICFLCLPLFVCVVLRIDPRASHTLGKYFTS